MFFHWSMTKNKISKLFMSYLSQFNDCSAITIGFLYPTVNRWCTWLLGRTPGWMAMEAQTYRKLDYYIACGNRRNNKSWNTKLFLPASVLWTELEHGNIMKNFVTELKLGLAPDQRVPTCWEFSILFTYEVLKYCHISNVPINVFPQMGGGGGGGWGLDCQNSHCPQEFDRRLWHRGRTLAVSEKKNYA